MLQIVLYIILDVKNVTCNIYLICKYLLYFYRLYRVCVPAKNCDPHHILCDMEAFEWKCSVSFRLFTA